ncbi:MAG: bifunctional phosphoribosylaminoimidazolecarboxamide formyltransferase/IMP cyclohydrolase [Candidatus Zixiibacteriota bacterium]
MPHTSKIKRALVSVSDKTGLVELCRELEKQGIEIISTGGTMRALRDAGVHVVSVSTYTGSPEILDGRVKTLHPRIHAGILYRRNLQEHIDQMQECEYKGIDLVIVNLYPFKETLARPGSTHDEIVENIDIGGPSMIRAAAKNYESVTVLVDPGDYALLLDELHHHKGNTSPEFRERCAARAFAISADYETAIAAYFSQRSVGVRTGFPDKLSLQFTKRDELRYGENPHQKAALYADPTYRAPSLVRAEILSGKELSFNNYGDLDACLEMVLDFTEPFACVVKHANPCGAAVGETIAEAYQKAYDSDPLSAYGSIIGLNQEVDMTCAQILHETPFVECMLAPSFTAEALDLLRKKKTRRLLALKEIARGRGKDQIVYRFLQGGLLAQTADDAITTKVSLQVVTRRQPTKEEIGDLLFAWKVVKQTKSNAIVLAKSGATVGIGMGQTSRVDSSFLAVKRAGERAKGAVCASDAFFPMPDGLEVAANAGVTAFIQPGGSKGDPDVIAAADKAGVAMVFTGIRHFRH